MYVYIYIHMIFRYVYIYTHYVYISCMCAHLHIPDLVLLHGMVRQDMKKLFFQSTSKVVILCWRAKKSLNCLASQWRSSRRMALNQKDLGQTYTHSNTYGCCDTGGNQKEVVNKSIVLGNL